MLHFPLSHMWFSLLYHNSQLFFYVNRLLSIWPFLYTLSKKSNCYNVSSLHSLNSPSLHPPSPPKPVTDWDSSIVQSPPSAQLSSWPLTKLLSAAWWSTALPSRLLLLPPTFLGFTLWKPRHFGSLASPAMRLSLWASHSLTAAWLVVFLSSTVSSPALLPLLSLRFVPTTFPQGAQGPPTTSFW